MPFQRLATLGVMIVLAVQGGAPVLADTAGLVGLDVTSGEAELRSRGYEYINSHQDKGQVRANWWNAENKSCVTVVTRDGDYDAVKNSGPVDCNQAAASRLVHDFHDLVGARASSVDIRMDRDGFRAVDRFDGTNVTSTWWHSRRTAECVKIDVVEERVERVSRAPGYPACKVN